MEITKYRHACLVLTKNNKSLVIDPGGWSSDFVVPENVVGIVITHEHGDHFDIDKLRKIIATNPSTYIYTHVGIIAQLEELQGSGVAVSVGDTKRAGPFSLQFTGGVHATIHSDYPVPTNVGVIVDNGEFYYPGDSFALPECPVKILAVPASAPWLKISEAMNFLTAVNPKSYFPTHDALLSPEGRMLAKTWLEKAADTTGSVFYAV